MILYTGQQRRYRHKEQTFGHSGGRRGWDNLREWPCNIFMTPQITCLKATPSRDIPQMLTSTTSKQGQNREERAALLRVRTGPECPEGNLRELT